VTITTEREFDGPYKELLSELASLIDWLQKEHDKSYVKAGDDKIYAFGGDGFVVVLDERVWDGLIELITPKGGVSIKPGDDGKISVTSAAEGEVAPLPGDRFGLGTRLDRAQAPAPGVCEQLLAADVGALEARAPHQPAQPHPKGQ